MAFRDSGGAKCAGTRTASATRALSLLESFFEPLIAGDQKASLASLSLVAPPIQALRGLPCLGSFSVVWCIRLTKGHPGWGPTPTDG